jgi:phenylpropionate dioxygenase-like ring-hydroxylating dioxygenase large terminal subunit
MVDDSGAGTAGRQRFVLASADLPADVVVTVIVEGDDAVVWRRPDGNIGAVARTCPHLDWDLAEACPAGDELVCRGHGWSIDGDGTAFKRNEFGRIDPKGTTRAWRLVERDDAIWLSDVT